MNFLDLTFGIFQALGILLSVTLLVLLLRGFLPQWIVLFFYSAVQAIITGIDIWGRVAQGGRGSPFYRDIYWTGEIVWDVLSFILVSVLILRTLEGRAEADMAKKILTIVLGAMIVLPFLLFANRRMFDNQWFNGASQVLNFGASILNLVLWGALIASRKRDRLLMMVSAGLGINVAGAALAWGVRQLGAKTMWPAQVQNAADVFAAVTWLAGIALWCYAFRPMDKGKPQVDVPSEIGSS